MLQKHVLRFIQPEVMLDYFEKQLQSMVQAAFVGRFPDQNYEEADYLSFTLEKDSSFFERLQQELQQLLVQLGKVTTVIRDHSCLFVFNEIDNSHLCQQEYKYS